MTESPSARRADRSHPWLLVLCLVGLDYFSTLAYLPSIAIEAAGRLAPLAALWIVLVTLLMALPVYCYVVGRSPDGRGAIGLLEKIVPGWRGKILMLALLGFAAADFVITRSLSIADAAVHVIHNPHAQTALDRISPDAQAVQTALGERAWSIARPMWTRQMGITLGLSLGTFAFWWLAHGGFNRKILWLAALVVAAYLVLTGIVIGSGLAYLSNHPQIVRDWFGQLRHHAAQGGSAGDNGSIMHTLASLALLSFPQLALGLSGFELTMTVAPLVSGRADDDPHHPRARIRNTRKLMVAATLIMAVFLTGSITVTTLLVPRAAVESEGAARHRALAYLAHGGAIASDAITSGAIAGDESAAIVNPWFGEAFGSLYDVSAIAILCLAGGSVINGLRNLLPHILHRLGMELSWTGRFGMMMHLLNAVILVVILVFHANLSAQQWAYATSVLVLMTGAALAATADVRERWRGLRTRALAVTPFFLICGFLAAMTLLTIALNASGLAIALAFVVTMTGASFVSRWIRSTELRFEGFQFASPQAHVRWKELRAQGVKILVPHRPGRISLAEKDASIRREHRLSLEDRIVFIEAMLGDPSEFYQAPLMRIDREGDLEVIRVANCVSVAHVLASIALELRQAGPPEIIFGWSQEPPLAANLNFLLLGEGNIPWMVKELVRKAEPDANRQPRIVIR